MAFPHKKLKTVRAPSEWEIDTSIDILRSRGRSHRAGVDTRFRQSADLENAGSIAMQGCQWRSDAAYLVNHHNGAMRHQNPSRLDKLPPVPKKKRRHHVHVEEEADDMYATSHQYCSDASVRALRDLRSKHFPISAEETSPQLEREIALERHKNQVVCNLKASLAMHMENFHGPGED